jgi:vancomycin aglycone glucosyltransferase
MYILFSSMHFCGKQRVSLRRPASDLPGVWQPAGIRADRSCAEGGGPTLGLRSILSQGWAGLTPGDNANDFISIDDVDHEKLFPRVAAIVHHGGAGTTTTAARTGRAQVIIPHNYDQFYWAHRVQGLGVGVLDPLRDDLTVDALAQALRETLQPEVTTRAEELASRIELHGLASPQSDS